MLMLIRANPIYSAAKGVVGTGAENVPGTTEVRYELPKGVTVTMVFDMNGSGVGVGVDFVPVANGFVLETMPNQPKNVVALCQGFGPVVGKEWGIGADSRIDMILEKLDSMEDRAIHGLAPGYK